MRKEQVSFQSSAAGSMKDVLTNGLKKNALKFNLDLKVVLPVLAVTFYCISGNW